MAGDELEVLRRRQHAAFLAWKHKQSSTPELGKIGGNASENHTRSAAISGKDDDSESGQDDTCLFQGDARRLDEKFVTNKQDDKKSPSVTLNKSSDEDFARQLAAEDATAVERMRRLQEDEELARRMAQESGGELPPYVDNSMDPATAEVIAQILNEDPTRLPDAQFEEQLIAPTPSGSSTYLRPAVDRLTATVSRWIGTNPASPVPGTRVGSPEASAPSEDLDAVYARRLQEEEYARDPSTRNDRSADSQHQSIQSAFQYHQWHEQQNQFPTLEHTRHIKANRHSTFTGTNTQKVQQLASKPHVSTAGVLREPQAAFSRTCRPVSTNSTGHNRCSISSHETLANQAPYAYVSSSDLCGAEARRFLANDRSNGASRHGPTQPFSHCNPEFTELKTSISPKDKAYNTNVSRKDFTKRVSISHTLSPLAGRGTAMTAAPPLLHHPPGAHAATAAVRAVPNYDIRANSERRPLEIAAYARQPANSVSLHPRSSEKVIMPPPENQKNIAWTSHLSESSSPGLNRNMEYSSMSPLYPQKSGVPKYYVSNTVETANAKSQGVRPPAWTTSTDKAPANHMFYKNSAKPTQMNSLSRPVYVVQQHSDRKSQEARQSLSRWRRAESVTRNTEAHFPSEVVIRAESLSRARQSNTSRYMAAPSSLQDTKGVPQTTKYATRNQIECGTVSSVSFVRSPSLREPLQISPTVFSRFGNR